jgi:hypothetical protein
MVDQGFTPPATVPTTLTKPNPAPDLTTASPILNADEASRPVPERVIRETVTVTRNSISPLAPLWRLLNIRLWITLVVISAIAWIAGLIIRQPILEWAPLGLVAGMLTYQLGDLAGRLIAVSVRTTQAVGRGAASVGRAVSRRGRGGAE